MPAKPSTALCLALLLLYPPSPALADDPKPDQEPPQIFFLECAGRRVPVDLDKPFRTDALAGAKSATLRVEPHRVFRYAGLVFHYPREYTFVVSLENPAVAVWTLAGSDCTIMVQRYPGRQDADAVRREFVGDLTALYQGAKTKQTDATCKLKHTTLKGLRLEVELAGRLLYQDLFCFPAGKDLVVLILQDSPQRDGQPSPDRTRAEKMLHDSLRLPGQPENPPGPPPIPRFARSDPPHRLPRSPLSHP